MIWISMLILAYLIPMFGAAHSTSHRRWSRKWGYVFAMPLFFVLAAAIFGSLILALIGTGVGTTHESRVGLKALSLNSQIEGSFFLGTGTLDDTQVFFYIAIHPEGYYSTVENVPARKARIYEDENKAPYLATETSYLNEWWYAPFPLGGFEVIYNFHIPDNSIVQDYAVDVGK